MRYVSTRSLSSERAFSDIVLEGLAEDGGLFVPKEYPRISSEALERMRPMSYAAVAFEILRRFATDIPEEDLRQLCLRTYRADVYCNVRDGVDASSIAPVMDLGDGLHLLQLSNGPTLAFKDMAMQFLGALFEYLLKQSHRELNILGATSGDTGSAAEYAMRGREGIRIFMLSPHNRMSSFQRAQMYTLQDSNIFNIALEGVFDDAQDIVKAVGSDAQFKRAYHIGSVNSINWARVAAQVVYYVYGWLHVSNSADEVVDVTVPTGNFGNVLAGWIAKQMGIPLGRLVVATNENDVLDEFFHTGVYRVRDGSHTYHTSSPSMDISKASNFERFIFDILGRDGARVRALWDDVRLHGEFRLAPEEFACVQQSGFASSRSTHEDRLQEIRTLWNQRSVLIDPHTADGMKGARTQKRAGIKMMLLETAQPAKFAETIEEAIGIRPPVPHGYSQLLDFPERFVVLPVDVNRVKDLIASQVSPL